MAKRPTIDLASLISTAEAADLSRSEIARRVGVSPPYITRLANGERGTRPSAQTFLALQRMVEGLPVTLPIGKT